MMLWRSQIHMVLALICAGALAPAYAGPPPEFPAPDMGMVKDGLLLQLAFERTEVIFGQRVKSYVRLENVGEEDLWLLVRDVIRAQSWPVCFKWSGQWGARFGFDGWANIGCLMYLEAGQSVIWRRQDFMLERGVHTVSLKYLYEPRGSLEPIDGLWCGEVVSNEVTITVLDEPLPDAERRALESELLTIVKEAVDQGDALPDSGNNARVATCVGAAGVYSFPALRWALAEERSVSTHALAARALSRWRGQEDATMLPYLLTALEKHMKRRVPYTSPKWKDAVQEMARVLSQWSDVMPEEETARVRQVLQDGMGLAINDVTWEFARSYLRLFPAEAIPILRTKLENPYFLRSERLKGLLRDRLRQAEKRLEAGE